jgi:hypothetical protein
LHHQNSMWRKIGTELFLRWTPSHLVLGTTCHIQNQKDWSNCCSRIWTSTNMCIQITERQQVCCREGRIKTTLATTTSCIHITERRGLTVLGLSQKLRV